MCCHATPNDSSFATIEAGEHIVVWDGTDAKGHAVSTGIYLYRLQAGDFVDTKKMVLMK